MHSIGFPPLLIAVFLITTIGLLWLDLKSHKPGQAVSLKSASLWSVFYIAVALAFAGFVHIQYGAEASSEFLAGYVLEKVLSVDNLAVFVAVFAYFGIKPEHQHRILHWGIIGAAIFRLIFVAIGASALAAIGPIAEGIFALIIAYTAVLMWKGLNDDDSDDVDYGDRWYIKLVKKWFPVNLQQKDKFFAKAWGGVRQADGSIKYKYYWMVTPAFLCLIAIEFTDVMFAFDSVPTVIAVTRDPVLIYSAMIFAILGLRSLYFILSALLERLQYLAHSIIVVLLFVAAKLGGHAVLGYHIDPSTSLAIVLGVLSLGVITSLLKKS